MENNILHRSLMGGMIDSELPMYLEAKSGALNGAVSRKDIPDTILYYSDDMINWKVYPFDDYLRILYAGNRVYFQCTVPNEFDKYNGNRIFSFKSFNSGTYHVGGNSMSLLYGLNFSGKLTLLDAYCIFGNMFHGDNNLISVSPTFLPATTLSENCYHQMFHGCENLIQAPILPAPILKKQCYYSMFNSCINLHYVKMLATTTVDLGDTVANYNARPLMEWLSNVSSSGTLVKHPNNNGIPTNSSSGVPTGGTVQTATS